MSIRIVDLSVALESFPSEYHDTLVTYWDHHDGARRLARDWKINPADLPHPNQAGAYEDVTALTHAGTHIDAPWHFGPKTDGQPAKTVDRMPLEWCLGDGVVLDFSQSKKDGEYIEVRDVEVELERISYRLKAGDIVLIWTGAGRHWGAPDYGARGSGLTAEVVFWFFHKGVRVLTTDAYTLDIPVPRMVEKFKAGDKEAFFPVHRAGRKVEYTHAEKVVNLQSLPASGFKVALFPVKVRAGSGAWTRAVAIFDDALKREQLRCVDLSVPLENFAAEYHQTSISYWDHYDFARRSAKGQGTNPADFPEPYVGGALELVAASTHAGTHVVAPWHFTPVGRRGAAMTIDQVPLEWCYGPGVVLDFTSKPNGSYISAGDLQEESSRIGHTLAPGDIAMLHTGAGDHWGAPDYVDRGAGLTADALRWLVERGVRAVTTDAADLDIPMRDRVQRFRNGEKQALFPIAEAARELEFIYAAKVVNLRQLPPAGFRVALFPVKVRRASSSWTRAVAIVNG